MREETLNLDLHEPELRQILTLKENDATTLHVSLLTNGAPLPLEGYLPLLCVLRPDNTAVVQENGITVTGNTLHLVLEPPVLAIPGDAQAEILLYKNNALLSTFRFGMAIRGNLLSEVPDASGAVVQFITSLDSVLHTIPVTEAVPGHLPMITSGGYLIDGGCTPTDFAAADHTHPEYAAAGHTHPDYLTAGNLSSNLQDYQTCAVDGGAYFTAGTVSGILQEIGAQLSGLDTALSALL